MNMHDLDTLPLPLTPVDRQELETNEAIIAQGLQTFYQVGLALVAIRNKKLYREQYRTFEDYCRDRWQISRPRAYQLIEAAGVMDNLSTIVDKPTNEAQARALTGLSPDQQQSVWTKAVETAPNGTVTAKHIDQVKQMTIPVKETPKPDRPVPPHIQVFDAPSKTLHTLTFSILYDGADAWETVTIREQDLAPKRIRTDQEAYVHGDCEHCQYAYSQHYLNKDGEGEKWCTRDILACQYLRERLHPERIAIYAEDIESEADCCFDFAEEEPDDNRPFAFYQLDRNKIVWAGLRLFRVCEFTKELKEFTPAKTTTAEGVDPGNFNSWKRFEVFPTKTALRKRIEELKEDRQIIFENYL